MKGPFLLKLWNSCLKRTIFAARDCDQNLVFSSLTTVDSNESFRRVDRLMLAWLAGKWGSSWNTNGTIANTIRLKVLKNTGNVDVNPLTLKQRWRNIESSVDLLLLEPLFQRWNRHRLMHLSNFLDMIFLYHWLYFWRLQSARSEFLRGLGIPMPTQVRSRCIQLKLLSLFHWMGTKFRQF